MSLGMPLVRRAMWMALVGIGITAVLSACPPPPPPTPANLPLVVGIEYAFPGLGAGFAQTRLPGVKFMPDIIGWDKMQPSAGAAINFSTLDRLVKEYQDAGFAECMVGLKSKSSWASVAATAPLPDTNYAPKPEYLDDYAAWVGAVVERYDGDGVNDMPGLRRAVRYYEIGVEFSTYEPEPVADYLTMLEAGYRAAHDADPNVIVMHAAFLVSTAFVNSPGPDEYEAAFAAVDTRIMYHSLDDIRAVLDRPDLFDAVNFHSLAGAQEIEATTTWLRYEMDARGYDKPLVISDTSPSPFIGWGPATRCTGNPAGLGIVIPPAAEDDRCRLAAYFTQLVDADPATLDWVHGFVAQDIARMVVVAAEQGIRFINTTFMEDLTPMQVPLFAAAAGNSAWAGMVDFTINLLTQQHTITGHRPLFYALQQLAKHMDHYNVVERLDAGADGVRLYRVRHTGALGLADFWIAWYDPGGLVLPGDAVPETVFPFGTAAQKVVVERLITQPDQTTATATTVNASNGVANITLTPVPVFIVPE